MDGVPVFNLVRETMPAVTIDGFRGVVNSTTNHILTALEDGEEFDAGAGADAGGGHRRSGSVARRRRLGRGGQGGGARQRVPRRADHAARRRAQRHQSERLRGACATPWRAGAAFGSSRRRARGERRRRSALDRAAESDLLAGLRGMANALVLETDTLGDIAISQLDGGLTHTAYALLSDLITIRDALSTRHVRLARPARRPDRRRSDARPVGSVLHDAARRHGRARHQDRAARPRRRHARLGSAVRRRRERVLPQHQPQQGEPDARS